MSHRLLLLVLWAALNAVCVQAQLCSILPFTITIASPKDAAKLAAAALCETAIIRAVWQGNVQLAETIVVGNGTSLTVTGASDATAVIDGGSRVQLFDVSGQLTLVNVTLVNGYAADSGGAIYSRANTKLTISGCVFSGHQARYGGAVLSEINSSLYITDSQFSNNICTGDGGAINSEVNNRVAVSGTQFSSNTAGLNAGAIYASNSSVCSINNSAFTHSNAEYGSAVNTSVGSKLMINDCVFSSNNGTVGTVYSGMNSTLTVSKSRFDSNTAVTGAAAIYAAKYSVCTISNNSEITNNSAPYAAVYTAVNSMLSIKACNFSSNRCTQYGGAVYIDVNSTATLSDSSFSRNTATLSGGAVFANKNSVCSINNSLFSNNSAALLGAAVYTNVNCHWSSMALSLEVILQLGVQCIPMLTAR
jgi:predicted outer membrane repeat protein